MKIAKHISNLLQFHECVIIPEFGGFISNYIPAKFDQVNHTLSPPTKAVVFNSKINNNDGLLINHIVENENIDYQQANTIVINFVDGLYRDLNKGEIINFKELGSFKFDKTGAIIYTPIDKFELISAYGLKTFSYPSFNDANTISTYRSKHVIRAISSKKDVLKIAASIALLLSLSLFPLKNNTLDLQSSNLNPIQFLTVDQTPDRPAEEKEYITIEDELETIQNLSPFVLIGGSFQHFNNANQLQRNLIVKGHQAEIVELDNGYFRVIIDSYSNQNDALKAKNTYLAIHPKSNVWVSKR